MGLSEVGAYHYNRLLNALMKRRFLSNTHAIFGTPPIVLKKGSVPLMIVTQLQSADIQAYLICIKALYRRIGYGDVTVLGDRLTAHDIDVLQGHIPGMDFVDVASITPGECQKGGTWERLWACVEMSQNRYVVQMDSDVLARGTLKQVLQNIQGNIPFALGGRMVVEPANYYPERAKDVVSEHINIASERAFARYRGVEKWNYIRASSGFAGFAAGGVSLDLVQSFHHEMHAILGSRWFEWGTEQVASNFVIANSPGAERLDFPVYANYILADQGVMAALPNMEMAHFLGINRYRKRVFERWARQEITALT